jgi:hypothetical protein
MSNPKRDERVLQMLSSTAKKVEKISKPVDPHKRFDQDDFDDPYGHVIRWVHERGTRLWA